MSYTFSFDASVKVTPKSKLSGLLNHLDRQNNETEIHHSNENIDPSRTSRNITWVRSDKGMKASHSHEEIEDAMRDRLAEAIDMDSVTYKNNGKAVRKDAVLAFCMVMQLDPQFYKDNPSQQDERRALDAMMSMAMKKFGKNLVAASYHRDESSPHLHLVFTPVTDDGRLSQKDFINSPKLKKLHKEFREELTQRGFDIDMERRTPLGAKRLSEKDYKEYQRLKEELEALREEQRQLEESKLEFERFTASQSQLLQDKEEELLQRERELEEPTTVALMARFLKGLNMNGRSAYEVFEERRPQLEEDNRKRQADLDMRIAELERKYARKPSRSNDFDFEL